ncbi:MAG: SET domain-containing protein-lysine N-methyltransferase [Nitrososphaerota archaeon]
MLVPITFELKLDNKKGIGLITKKPFKKEEIVIKEAGIIIRSRKDATINSVQIGPNRFVDAKLSKFTDHINHSCDPNTRYDIDTFEFIAIKDIKIGDEITFNYLSTDWDLKSDGLDFDCFCGSSNCLGHISGYRYLIPAQQKQMLQKPRNE